MTKIAKRPELIAMIGVKQTMAARLAAFAKSYSLSRAGLSMVFGTPEQTIGNWLKGRVLPPPCSIVLVEILEQSEEARQIAGVSRWRVKQDVVKREASRKRRARPENAFAVPAGSQCFDVELFVEGPVPESSILKE